jgi:UDP-N-acetylmuramyl pentapeptide synthase
MKEAGEKIMLENENCQFEFFDNPMSAGEKVKKMVQLGDVVLVKGSQGMRMEKVVEQLIQDKENMKNLLCRQDEVWKRKEYKMP